MNHFLFKTLRKINSSLRQPSWQRFNDAFKDTGQVQTVMRTVYVFILFLMGLFDHLLSVTVNLLPDLPLLFAITAALHLQLLSRFFRLSWFNTRPLIIFGLITSAWTGGALEIMT